METSKSRKVNSKTLEIQNSQKFRKNIEIFKKLEKFVVQTKKVSKVPLNSLALQLMMNSSVRIDSIQDLERCDVEKHIDDDGEGNWGEENSDSEPADGFLILEEILAFNFPGVEVIMCENGEDRQKNCHSPSVAWIPAIFASVCDSQENVPRPESLPDVITHAVEPKECAE